MTEHSTPNTLAQACADARYHNGLRSLTTTILTTGSESVAWIVRADLQLGADGRYSAHASGQTVEKTETAAIARVLALGCNITIGNGSQEAGK